MKREPTFISTGRVPCWSTPADARKRLDHIIDEFVQTATRVSEDPDEDCASLALKVTAGLGKTATTLRTIARHGPALLARGHVLIYMPTLDLAERAHSEFRNLAPDTPSRVILGREALRPGDQSRQMCERADLAKRIAGFVPSVTQALCRRLDANGKPILASCASGCPYLEQKDVAGPHIVFLSHAYLTVRPPIDDDYPVALRVIDEKVWPTLTRISRLPIEDFMRPPLEGFPDDLRDALFSAKALVIDGLQRGLPLHEHARSAGLTTGKIKELAVAESKSRGHLEITPAQDFDAINFRVATFDKRAFMASRRRQRVFSQLSETENGHCNSLRLIVSAVDGIVRQTIEVSETKDVPRDAPLLLLDADADPDITERIVPGAELVVIESPPVADIVQVQDRTLSNTWLLDADKGPARRAMVLSILEREVGQAARGGVLIVATKAVLRALHEDVFGSIPQNDAGLRQPLLGAVPRWFGPRTQGVNDFEGYAAIVVVGRLQPNISDIEASARAVFGKDALPIVSHDTGPFPAQETFRLMSDGAQSPATRRTHSDLRVHAIMAQTRECGTLQAIARLRLVTPDRRKRVVILSSLPLPGFPITRLATLGNLARGLEHEPDPQGYLRMETALRAIRDRPVCGTRLSARGLAADLPRAFGQDSTAKAFRRGRPTDRLIGLCERVAAQNGWPISHVFLRTSSGGQRVPAIVLAPSGEALQHARRIWPGLQAART